MLSRSFNIQTLTECKRWVFKNHPLLFYHSDAHWRHCSWLIELLLATVKVKQKRGLSSEILSQPTWQLNHLKHSRRATTLQALWEFRLWECFKSLSLYPSVSLSPPSHFSVFPARNTPVKLTVWLQQTVHLQHPYTQTHPYTHTNTQCTTSPAFRVGLCNQK